MPYVGVLKTYARTCVSYEEEDACVGVLKSYTRTQFYSSVREDLEYEHFYIQYENTFYIRSRDHAVRGHAQD
jgi:hypothetical protein